MITNRNFVDKIFNYYKEYEKSKDKNSFDNLSNIPSTKQKVDIFEYFLHRTDLFKQKNINFIKARIPINIIQYIELLLKTYESNNFKNKLTKTRSNYNQLSKDKNFSNTIINNLTKKMQKLNKNKNNYLKQKENLQKKINEEEKKRIKIEENYKIALQKADTKYTTNLSEEKTRLQEELKRIKNERNAKNRNIQSLKNLQTKNLENKNNKIRELE